MKSVQSCSFSAPEVYSVKEKKVFLVKYQNLFLAICFWLPIRFGLASVIIKGRRLFCRLRTCLIE